MTWDKIDSLFINCSEEQKVIIDVKGILDKTILDNRNTVFEDYKGAKMIRILHYVGIMDMGGMETLIMNLYRNIDRAQTQFDFAVHMQKEGDFDQEIKSLGGRIYYFPPMRKNPYKYRKAWDVFFESHIEEIDVIHFHTNSLANIIALKSAFIHNIPIRIVHSHSTYSNKGKLQILNNILHKHNQKRLDRYVNRLIACSEKAAHWLFGGMELKGLKVQIIKNGVDTKYFSYNQIIRDNIRKELNIENFTVIGHIGKFIPVKNHSFLLDIFNEITKIDHSAILLLIGDGPLYNEIIEKSKKLSLNDKIMFLGVRNDIRDLIMGMDLFLMPSLYEGLPVSMIEVQAVGLSALISDTITKEVIINENVKSLSLEVPSDLWVKAAYEMLCKNERIIEKKKLLNAGYDIKSSVDKYLEIINYNNRINGEKHKL